jgi:hypothetical protein
MMTAENTSGVPPVQNVRLVNVAWMNCTLRIEYDQDPNTGAFRKNQGLTELMKDQTSWIDLSTLEGIKPLDVIRVHTSAYQPQTAEPIRYNKNGQTATYQFSGTLFKSWLSKL